MIVNREHVCGLYDLEPHFENRDPLGRQTFDWLCGLLDRLGGYDILPMKTMIAFAHGANFALVKTRKRGVELQLVLGSVPNAERFQFVVEYSKAKSIYKTVFLGQADLNDELAQYVTTAYDLTRLLFASTNDALPVEGPAGSAS